MNSENQLPILFQQLSALLINKKLMLGTAESCTGGLIAKLATDLSGSSQWFDRGIVTYSNNAKHELLGVSDDTLVSFGAVSDQTVTEMVNGLLSFAAVSVGVAISGVAGPTGGSDDKPVGTVWIACKVNSDEVQSQRFVFTGNRDQVRQQAAIESVKKLIKMLKNDQ